MVSIVMPVYNTGKYLAESLQSILSQSYTDFELICVDDCCDDELTKEILHECKSKDSRVKVISFEQNVGAAKARNIGLENAKGEYITFLDADDIFHRDMLLLAYDTAKKYDADMCIWGFRAFDVNGGNKYILYEFNPHKIETKTDHIFELSELPENGLNLWTTAPWTKLCKRSFLVDNNIKFQTLKSSNDVYYSIMCAIYSKKIVYVEEEPCLVDYRTGTDTQISANRDPRCVCEAIEEVLKKIKTDEHLNKQIAYVFLSMMRYEFRNSHNVLWREESYYRLRNILNKQFKDVVFEENTYNILRKKIEEVDYSYGQFFLSGDFEEQLRGVQNELKEIIASAEELVVWGNGRRGSALLSIAHLLDSKRVVVVDSRNDNVGLTTKTGNSIMHTDDIKGRKCTIIATNTYIYDYIKSSDDYKDIKVINLEPYCPVG